MTKPRFWKLSQGAGFFNFNELLQSIENRLVYINSDTPAKGTMTETQAEMFIKAEIGDYFYLTHSNDRIYLLGQFTGPANYFSDYENWLDRPFRIIKRSKNSESYGGVEKWWTPNHNSTFIQVPENELALFEDVILVPYFNIKLNEYGIKLGK